MLVRFQPSTHARAMKRYYGITKLHGCVSFFKNLHVDLHVGLHRPPIFLFKIKNHENMQKFANILQKYFKIYQKCPNFQIFAEVPKLCQNLPFYSKFTKKKNSEGETTQIY